jgi:hypothetical protein
MLRYLVQYLVVCTKYQDVMAFAKAQELLSLSLMASSSPKMSSSPRSSSTYSSNRSPAAVDISKDAKDLYDLESYTHSTDLFRDHATVTSAKTTGTNYTASTRKSRRPGQAKMRLQQQKLGETSSTTRRSGGSQQQQQQQQRGWQETMKRAAAETNKTWDPRHGWANYVTETDDVPSQFTPEVLSPPRPNRSNNHRIRTQAPLMIDVEGEDEKINIFDDLRDCGPYFEV